jgi:Ribosomal protein S1
LPASQIDVVPPKDLQQFVGNTYDFKIVKLNDDRKNVVLSRREVIEKERSEKRQKFLESVNLGDRVVGTSKTSRTSARLLISTAWMVCCT